MAEEQGTRIKEEVQMYAQMEKMAKWIYTPLAKRIAKNLEDSKRGLRVLDLGAGPGFLSIELDKLLPETRIVEVDPSNKMLQLARRNAEKAGMSNYEIKLGRAEEIPLESSSVDLVVTQDSLHQWQDPKQGFSEVYRVLKTGGTLMLIDPNRGCAKWKVWLFGLINWLGGSGKKPKEWRSEFYEESSTFEEVVNLLKNAGFDEIEGEGRGIELFVRALKRWRADERGTDTAATI